MVKKRIKWSYMRVFACSFVAVLVLAGCSVHPADPKISMKAPVYVELPGWKTDMTKMQSEDEFPEEFNAYLSFLEDELGVPIKIVSVGPDRDQTIERYTED
jgi:adenylosuccinate synthase